MMDLMTSWSVQAVQGGEVVYERFLCSAEEVNAVIRRLWSEYGNSASIKLGARRISL